MSGTIRVSEFHRMMAERGMGEAAEITKNNTRWSTTNTRSDNGPKDRDNDRNTSSSMGFTLFGGSGGSGMRGSRGDLFAKTLATVKEEDEKSVDRRDGTRDTTRDRGRDRGQDDSGYVRKSGKGTWKIEELYSVKREPEEVVKPKPRSDDKNEFPDLEIGNKETVVEKKSVWGSKKEVIETIKTSTMEEINAQTKKRKKEEKYKEYVEKMEENVQEMIEKKKKEWISRLKKQYSKDCNYRSIEDILKEEEPFMIYTNEVDPISYLEEQMYYESMNNRNIRIDKVDPIDTEWLERETDLLVLSEWSREDNHDDYEIVEERVWKNDVIFIRD